MAKAPTEEQLQLRRRARRRLIGAIALVTLVAVVLPWVMEHEPRQVDREVAIQIPSQDSSAFNPKAAPSPRPADKPREADASARHESSKTSPPPADDSLRAEQDKILAAPAKAPSGSTASREKDKPATEAKKKPVEKAEASADGKQFVVQIAALADTDKAADIQKQLAAKGLKAYTERIKTDSGEVTRVRVGPFPSREAADKERGRMRSLGFDGNVTPR